jgi:alkylhydroperoxidase family enzyme
LAFIRMIPDEEAEGSLKRQYDAAIGRAGKVFNVVRIFSLRPAVMRSALAVYRDTMFGESELTRAEREMIAVVTSQANDCHY